MENIKRSNMRDDPRISFPPESEALRRRVNAERHLTPTERVFAVLETLAAAERMSLSGKVREAQLAYHQRCEEEWHRCMSEFIRQNVAPDSSTS